MTDALNHLATYVDLIHGGQADGVALCDHQSDLSQQEGVEEETGIYRFHNGVVIRYQREQDLTPVEDDQQCAECWLSYEVQEAAGRKIWPTRKVFYNHCQLTFWLRIQQRQIIES